MSERRQNSHIPDIPSRPVALDQEFLGEALVETVGCLPCLWHTEGLPTPLSPRPSKAENFSMRSIHSMYSIPLLTFWFVVLASVSCGIESFAQETEIAAIYLDEPEQEPPAQVARHQRLKKAYKTKSPHWEREVSLLSDDRVVNDGIYVEYYREGQKYVDGTYKMGVFDGKWQYWYPNGQLCKKISYKNGRPHGHWEVFNKEGERASEKGYQNGKRHGVWITYYEGGKQPKLEINYGQGLAIGKRISYYENGQKRQSISFEEGRMEGPMMEWDETGKKLGEATFKAGKLVGKIKRFNDE